MARYRERYREWLHQVSGRIVAAQRPIRVLRAVTWPDTVKERFFAGRFRELPRPQYPPLGFDPRATVSELADILKRLRIHDPLERILMETCVSYINCARMLARIGTREFHLRSRELYGAPGDPFDESLTQLDLALHFDQVLAGFTDEELGRTEPKAIRAPRAVAVLRRRFGRAFGALEAPRVKLARLLTADAAAGAGVVKIKRDRRFNRASLAQLEQHEGYVHAATTLNGRRQRVLPCLGKGPPRTARVQEGLAVFAELTTQNVDVRRLRALKDRILAIQMAQDGADFLQLFDFFRAEGQDDDKAFDSARRVVRGGLVEGGAPFTKDLVYLDGLVRVYHWAQVAMKRGRPELLRFLWVGKVTIEDVPVLYAKHREGVIDPPAFLPPWVRNVDYLAAYMCFSGFLGRLDLGRIERSYAHLLEEA